MFKKRKFPLLTFKMMYKIIYFCERKVSLWAVQRTTLRSDSEEQSYGQENEATVKRVVEHNVDLENVDRHDVEQTVCQQINYRFFFVKWNRQKYHTRYFSSNDMQAPPPFSFSPVLMKDVQYYKLCNIIN